MCLAVPMRIEEIAGDTGVVDTGGGRKNVNLLLVSPVAVGQYVLVHAGFALEVLDEEDAKKTLDLFNEMKAHGWQEAGP